MHIMERFLEENPSFQAVYHCVIMASRDRKELMELMTDFFAEEDIFESLRLTNESRIKRLTKELDEKDRELNDQKQELSRKNRELTEKENLIAALQKQLEAVKK